jgi:hypothetical protein
MPTLSGIFGNDLIQIGQSSCGTDKGMGEISLGYFLPNCMPTLYISPRHGEPDQSRMKVSDGAVKLDLSVTDIRLYQNDHITPNNELVNHIAGKLRKSNVVLSVGLTRASQSHPSFSPVHWLQVNNIHLQENPVWQLG